MRSFLFTFATVVLVGPAFAEKPGEVVDWPGWLGAERDGVWRETGILEKFPAGGPKVLWRTPIGAGFSGPAELGGKVYVMDRRTPAPDPNNPPPKGTLAGTERVLCLDAASGKILWEHEYDCPYAKISYPAGPRVTPMLHAGKVYVLGTMGDFKCLDAESGKVVWEKNLDKEFKMTHPIWGHSATPLIDGDQIICLVGGPGSAVAAFDLATGKERWRALTSEEIGYVPPVIVSPGKQRQLIVFLSESLNGLDPATGKVFWTEKYPANGEPTRPAVPIAMPRILGDKLIVSAGYHGSLMVQLDREQPTAKVLWRSDEKGTLEKPDGLHALMTTPIFKDGYIYGVGPMGELRCQKADDNKTMWETLQLFGGKKSFCGTAFIVPQGDRYFLFTDQGELVIAKMTPKGYEEIDRAKVIEPSQNSKGRTVVYSHPAYARQCAFIRNDKEIICVSLAQEKK